MAENELLLKILGKLDHLEQGQQELKADVSELKTDVTLLKKDVADLKTRVTKIEVVQEAVTNKQIQLLIEGQQGMNEKFRKLDRIDQELTDVASQVEVVQQVVTQHSGSIRALQTAK